MLFVSGLLEVRAGACMWRHSLIEGLGNWTRGLPWKDTRLISMWLGGFINAQGIARVV